MHSGHSGSKWIDGLPLQHLTRRSFMSVVVQFLGRSGSGKSTLLANLVEELGRERCVWSKNSRPPVSTAWVGLRAALRVVQLVRLLSTRNFLARGPSARWRALRRAA